MAVCTRCGAVMNDLDAKKHVCKAENIPGSGVEKIDGILRAV